MDILPIKPLFAVLALIAATAFTGLPAGAQTLERPGWAVHQTKHGFSDLNTRLDQAIAAESMALVTQASASAGASSRGITIAGNRVVGVYRNDFAVRMLEASLAAGIEAPIRFYVTENADGTATLSYKTPTSVFSPYFAEGGAALKALAAELDAIFGKIAANASGG